MKGLLLNTLLGLGPERFGTVCGQFVFLHGDLMRPMRGETS